MTTEKKPNPDLEELLEDIPFDSYFFYCADGNCGAQCQRCFEIEKANSDGDAR